MSDTRTCPKCGRHYAADVTYCPQDGAPLAHAGADPLLGTTLSGGVKVLSPCGAGSMGTVYRAWQLDMEREVAVKVLRHELAGDPRIVKRFYREARAVARLSHPNIVTLHAAARTDEGHPFLVMEFIRGASLDELCLQGGPLPAVRAIHICRQITSALAEAHANGVVHRDLKPANIVVTDRRNLHDFVKVLDFSIAKILFDDGDAGLTQTGAIFGTPHFIAPEQASGERPNHRADIYSLGVVLFRMITGRLPFDSPDGMEVLVQQIKQDPPLPRDIVPGVPTRLQEVVLRALSKKPEDRWQTADEFGNALRGVYEDLRGWKPEWPARALAAASVGSFPQPSNSAAAPMPVARVSASAFASSGGFDLGSATRRAAAPISALPESGGEYSGMSTRALQRQLRGRTGVRRTTVSLLVLLAAIAALALWWMLRGAEAPDAAPDSTVAKIRVVHGAPDAAVDQAPPDSVAEAGQHAESLEASTTAIQPARAKRRGQTLKRTRRRRPTAALRAEQPPDAGSPNDVQVVDPVGPAPHSPAPAKQLSDHGAEAAQQDPSPPAVPDAARLQQPDAAPPGPEEEIYELVD